MANSSADDGSKPEPRSLWHNRRKWYLFWMPLGGIVMFVAGIIFWGGFHTVLEWTNTETFCVSCHEMRDNVYQEYKETIHYKNRTGVRATCPDCHVPKPWIYKIRAQDSGLKRAVPQGGRHHRHPGEVREPSPGARRKCLGDDEVDGFARMPQLPRV